MDDPKACLRDFVKPYLPENITKRSIKNAKVVTVGSCFATNIAKPLKAAGAQTYVYPHG